MNLKVTEVNNVTIEGQTKRLYYLFDQDELGFDTIMYLENYGVIQGGPLYNFNEQWWCDGYVVDIPFILQHKMIVNNQEYLYSPCDTVVFIEEFNSNDLKINYSEGYFIIQSDVEIYSIIILDELGRIVNNCTNCSKIPDRGIGGGIRFLNLETSAGIINVRLNKNQ